ncbi:hypothetical protein Patl1_05615 [Pistacia atlantica]|uniref:Uncharacterized protein n=1 Tax=Pistacia atlantica TaxID=434234 RepID=A0ACC1BT03_9ROSI|nr:hypothetical protein Patl1_05615 [Pistacia atlantica]
MIILTHTYVEIILDIFYDSVAIHSIQGVAVHEDPELSSLIKKALENKSPSSVGFLFIWKHLFDYQEGIERAQTPACFTHKKTTCINAF